MGCNGDFRHFRDCDRFWDDLMFCRRRHRDCDDRRCRRDRDCDRDYVEIGKFLSVSAFLHSTLFLFS
ncbi:MULTISPECIES: hypothetical protein [Bacillus cereus group]|uniref:hypothetical protein n=1 Tax=Bacillus cereus group TaxID=86661 RepID=UPI003709B70D